MFLEHVNLTVSDLDRSIDFYGDLLGLDVRWRGQAVGERGSVPAAHLGDHRCYLALFEAETPVVHPVAFDYAQPGLNHFGFVVDDYEATRARALALGAKIHFEPEYAPGRRFYVTDPDGMEIELVAYEDASGAG